MMGRLNPALLSCFSTLGGAFVLPHPRATPYAHRVLADESVEQYPPLAGEVHNAPGASSGGGFWDEARLEGWGGDVDHGAARTWLHKAAGLGSADAFHWLGVMAEYGLGRDGPALNEALESYRAAAAKGHDAANFHLGLAYAYGRGANQDLGRAMLLFQEGAQRRHGGSMYYIGLMTLYGHGVPVDYDVARYWFQRAESANDAAFGDLASNARRELEASLQMAETFIAEAEANWTSANEPPEGLKYNTA